MQKEGSWPKLRYYHAACIEQLKKTVTISDTMVVTGQRFQPDSYLTDTKCAIHFATPYTVSLTILITTQLCTSILTTQKTMGKTDFSFKLSPSNSHRRCSNGDKYSCRYERHAGIRGVQVVMVVEQSFN